MGTTLSGARPAGGRRLLRALGGLLIAAVLLGSGQVARADHETRDGLYSDTQYISVQFLYEFQWEAPWEADLDSIESVEDEYDRIVVGDRDAAVEVVLTFGEDPEAVLEAVIDARADEVDDLEVVGRGEDVDGFDFPVFSATFAYEVTDADGDEVRRLEYVEVGYVFTGDGRGDGGTRTLSLVTPADELEDAYQEIQDVFVIYSGFGGDFFAGQPTFEGDDDDRDREDDDSDDRGSDDRGSDEDDRGSDEDDEDERAAGTGLDGDAYQSPTFGYIVEWDEDVWEPREATSEDGVDTLVLESRRSYLYFWAGTDYYDDPEDCLEDLADYMSVDEGVDDWEPLEDDDGEPVAGARRSRAWAAFTLTYTTEGGDEYENANYLECRSLGEGEAILAIVHITSQNAYEDESEAVDEVLDTIEPPDEDDDRDGSDRDRDRDEDDRAGAVVERESYTNPAWGFTVSWDPALWTRWGSSSEDEVALGWVESGIMPYPFVTVTGIANFDGDPEACLAARVAEAEESEPGLVLAEGIDLPASAPDAVAALYELNDGGLYAYYECRTLVPGEAVVQIMLFVYPSDYDEVRPTFEEILAEFQLPEE